MGISLDTFIVGFGLGTLQISVFAVAFIFGLVTFCMAIIGIIAGGMIRDEAEKHIAHIAGGGRVVTGAVFMLIAIWKIFEI